MTSAVYKLDPVPGLAAPRDLPPHRLTAGAHTDRLPAAPHLHHPGRGRPPRGGRQASRPPGSPTSSWTCATTAAALLRTAYVLLDLLGGARAPPTWPGTGGSTPATPTPSPRCSSAPEASALSPGRIAFILRRRVRLGERARGQRAPALPRPGAGAAPTSPSSAARSYGKPVGQMGFDRARLRVAPHARLLPGSSTPTGRATTSRGCRTPPSAATAAWPTTTWPTPWARPTRPRPRRRSTGSPGAPAPAAPSRSPPPPWPPSGAWRGRPSRRARPTLAQRQIPGLY